MDNGRYKPESEPNDMDQLKTVHRFNLVAAINELHDRLQTAEFIAHAALGASGSVTIPALPAGAIITGLQGDFSAAYSSGATIEVGDHSGTSGASAPSALTSALGTATATGNAFAPLFFTPVGDLTATVVGGGGSIGAVTVAVRYILG